MANILLLYAGSDAPFALADSDAPFALDFALLIGVFF